MPDSHKKAFRHSCHAMLVSEDLVSLKRHRKKALRIVEKKKDSERIEKSRQVEFRELGFIDSEGVKKEPDVSHRSEAQDVQCWALELELEVTG